SIFHNNSAGGVGGGIHNGGDTLTVTNSTIANNSAGAGGGISNVSAGTGTAMGTNSTIANNSAGGGGGSYNLITLRVSNSPIAYNNVASGGIGGGLEEVGFGATLDNTIVALNTSGGTVADDISFLDGFGGTVTGAYNLIGTGGSGNLVNGVHGNQVGVSN